MAVANVGWDLALELRRPRGDARYRQPGEGAQRAALLGAVVAAGAAHPRVCAGGAGDLGAWKDGSKLDCEGKHYRFTLMTPNFVPEPYDGPLPRLGARRRRPGHAEGRGGRIRTT